MPVWLPPGFHTVTVGGADNKVFGTTSVLIGAAITYIPQLNEVDVDGDLRPDRCDPDLTDGPLADQDLESVAMHQTTASQ